MYITKLLFVVIVQILLFNSITSMMFDYPIHNFEFVIGIRLMMGALYKNVKF